MSEEGDSLYGVLQTSRDAPAAAIRRAYKRLALELHPDKNKSPQAAELYQRVKLAHEVAVSIYVCCSEGITTTYHRRF